VTELVQTILLGLLVGGVYALLASGLTLIFGVLHVINIAHGAFLILAAFLTYSLWSGIGLDPLLAIAITTRRCSRSAGCSTSPRSGASAARRWPRRSC
jgi:branched-chain amino acid transport system permease protein